MTYANAWESSNRARARARARARERGEETTPAGKAVFYGQLALALVIIFVIAVALAMQGILSGAARLAGIGAVRRQRRDEFRPI
jgi:hypothetical protein